MHLDASEFEHSASTGYSLVLGDMAFSSDRNLIYFLELEGDLYEYNRSSEILAVLTDISPRNTLPRDFFLNRTSSVEFISDSLLLIAGRTYVHYDINLNSRTLLKETTTIDDIGRDSFEAESMSFYRGTVLGLDAADESVSNGKDIFVFDPFNPKRRDGLLETNHIAPSSCIFEYRTNCDSSELWVQSFDMSWHAIDLVEGTLELKTPIFYPSENSSLLAIKHYPDPSWAYCDNYIDLDQNDDTAINEDFFYESTCSHILPIADVDLSITSRTRLDSIICLLAYEEGYLTINSGNYSIRRISPQRIHIVANSTTTSDDFITAIKNTEFTLTGAPPLDTVEIVLTPYSSGKPGIVATAKLLLSNRFANAGIDRNFNLCKKNSLLDYTDLVDSDSMDIGGIFLNSNLQVASVNTLNLNTVGHDTIYYVVTNDSCTDTSQWTIQIHEQIEAPIIDTITLCHGGQFDIDLSDQTHSVTWSDNSTEKFRSLRESGEYNLTIGLGTECEVNVNFFINILTPPQERNETYILCPYDSVEIDQQWYYSEQSFKDTTKSFSGCDSVITLVTIAMTELATLEWSGKSNLCEGDQSRITILSDGTNWRLNDLPVEQSFVINEPGLHHLTGYNTEGCQISDTLHIVALDQPLIELSDLTDTTYSFSLQLAPRIYGTISSIEWVPSTGLSCSDCPSPFLKTDAQSEYSVNVTNDLGCVATARAMVNLRTSKYYVPNVINPLSEFQGNTAFYLQSESVVRYNLTVYNRWGGKVFSAISVLSNDIEYGWLPLSDDMSGVYIYKIIIDDLDNSLLKGDITVIR